MNTVGLYLKKEREAKIISLKEVAQITKISPIYLEYIEKNEFDKIPQGPYIKGYIGSYSSAIGCDADKIINLYEFENRKQTQAEAIQPTTVSIDGGNIQPTIPRRKDASNQAVFGWVILGHGLIPLYPSLWSKEPHSKRPKNRSTASVHPNKIWVHPRGTMFCASIFPVSSEPYIAGPPIGGSGCIPVLLSWGLVF